MSAKPGSRITHSRLIEVYSYCRNTGVFTRIGGASSGATVGSIAGAKQTKGYIRIRIDRKQFQAHQLAWLYVFGRWPEMQIDHANGDTRDNRIENLRIATASQNSANKNFRVGASGYRGVVRYGRRFRAQITVEGRREYLGFFDDPACAAAAYDDRAKSAWGPFARVNFGG